MLLSHKFKKESKDLREEIATLARKLATEIIDPSTIDSLIACRLIPLNKIPGVRPIGIGEVLRRIIGKAIGWTLKTDIQESAGPLQTSTGLKAGADTEDDTDAVILVDARRL